MSLHFFTIVVAFFVGLGLGLLYFGGLWFTIQKLPQTPHPIPLIMGSLLLRFAIALGSVYLLMNYFAGEQILTSLLAFSLGFLLTRNFLISRLRPR